MYPPLAKYSADGVPCMVKLRRGLPLTPRRISDFMSSGVSVNGPRSATLARRQLLFAIFALPLILLGCGRRPNSEQQVVDLDIESDGDFLAFVPETLTCRTGALVRLTFHHAGKILSARHDWVLTYPGRLEALTKDSLDHDGVLSKNDPLIIAMTPLCDKGETVMVEFIAPRPGDYPFVCSTHPEDMSGILHVTS